MELVQLEETQDQLVLLEIQEQMVKMETQGQLEMQVLMEQEQLLVVRLVLAALQLQQLHQPQ
jgi:uncharacterized protein YjfI (DUF2170 family)